jgi:methylsterol monooxygenase
MWPSAHAHDFHHMTSNSCFGKSLVLDRLHGTDKDFRVYMARKKETEEQERLTQISNKLK